MKFLPKRIFAPSNTAISTSEKQANRSSRAQPKTTSQLLSLPSLEETRTTFDNSHGLLVGNKTRIDNRTGEIKYGNKEEEGSRLEEGNGKQQRSYIINWRY